jgi:hypothetical protein
MNTSKTILTEFGEDAFSSSDLDVFTDVAAALREIRDRRLYRETHSTFDAYALATFGIAPPLLTDAILNAGVA